MKAFELHSCVRVAPFGVRRRACPKMQPWILRVAGQSVTERESRVAGMPAGQGKSLKTWGNQA